jgi:hypothetical protein
MKKLIRVSLIVGLLFFNASLAFAQGRRTPLLTRSEYFVVYGQDEVDLYTLLTKLDFNYLLQLESLEVPADPNLQDVLAKTMDALYAQVSDILNINVYSFHGTVKFLRDRRQVEGEYYRIYRTDFKEPAFYHHDRDTIYISYADLTLGMLGRAIAEAILSHYFVVPPTEKVREVLSGYVEYSLREASGTGPGKTGGERLRPPLPAPDASTRSSRRKFLWLLPGLAGMLVLGFFCWKINQGTA